MDRFYSLPETAKHFYCFSDVDDIKQHPDYIAAKSGEAEPAYRLVTDIASQFLKSLVGEFPQGAYFVSPFAQEADGDNAIPLLLSLLAAKELKRYQWNRYSAAAACVSYRRWSDGAFAA